MMSNVSQGAKITSMQGPTRKPSFNKTADRQLPPGAIVVMVGGSSMNAAFVNLYDGGKFCGGGGEKEGGACFESFDLLLDANFIFCTRGQVSPSRRKVCPGERRG